MSSIWDEKPESFYKELLSYGHCYEAGSMDRWLETVKLHIANLNIFRADQGARIIELEKLLSEFTTKDDNDEE